MKRTALKFAAVIGATALSALAVAPAFAAAATSQATAQSLNLAIGGTYMHESGFHVDAGYQFIVFFKHDTNAPQLPGEYGGIVDLLGLTVGFSTPLDSYR